MQKSSELITITKFFFMIIEKFFVSFFILVFLFGAFVYLDASDTNIRDAAKNFIFDLRAFEKSLQWNERMKLESPTILFCAVLSFYYSVFSKDVRKTFWDLNYQTKWVYKVALVFMILKFYGMIAYEGVDIKAVVNNFGEYWKDFGFWIGVLIGRFLPYITAGIIVGAMTDIIIGYTRSPKNIEEPKSNDSAANNNYKTFGLNAILSNSLDSFLSTLKKYVDFTGRATRQEFWIFQLIKLILIFLTAIFNENFSNFLFFILLAPSLAVSTRRLHDTNRSGLWVAVGAIISPFYATGFESLSFLLHALISIFTFIYITLTLYFFCLKGDESSNKYG
jgi:uncharacterized membrane protein YhaH (DUF805 family)